jgi:pimeloyl-ACP methyl ester carboxylesterase
VSAPSAQLLEVDGAELCAESFGDPAHPAILLFGGAAASMDWWETEFCQRLADGSRLVIRWDHRDTGRSTTYPPGEPGYTGDDMVADGFAVLDGFGVERAHVVGMSMGGALAQVATLEYPDRVGSLTLISTSPSGRSDDLPGMSEAAAARYAAIAEPDWADREAVTDYLVALGRASASPNADFDEAGYRRLAGHVLDRSSNMASTMRNHYAAEGTAPWRDRLGEIAVPTLVIHGRDDPAFPPAHGAALANEIAGARLLILERTGHELPRRTWDVVVPAILKLTEGA